MQSTLLDTRRRRIRGQLSEQDPQRPGHERWLVSYADFMTLLMAFFVVMYSISQVSEQKYRVLSETFSEAFKSPDDMEILVQSGEPQLSHTSTPIDLDGQALQDRPGNDASEVPETFVRITEQLEQSFQELISSEMIQVRGDERWLQIELPSAVLFESGGIKLSEPASEIIRTLADSLDDFNNVIRVEGFTDNVPISTSQFASNWELSAARATTVVRMLAENGIDPARLAATGYGEFQPVASNQTLEGRDKNRRIVLMVSTRERLREDVFEAPEQDIEAPDQDDVYPERTPLPEGTLVRGLEQSALDQARQWLANRYLGASDTDRDANSAEINPDEQRAPPADAVSPSIIQPVQLEDGGLLFSRSTN